MQLELNKKREEHFVSPFFLKLINFGFGVPI